MLTAPKRNPLNRDMDPISVPFWMIKTLPYIVRFRVHVRPTMLAKELKEEKSNGVQGTSCMCTEYAASLASNLA